MTRTCNEADLRGLILVYEVWELENGSPTRRIKTHRSDADDEGLDGIECSNCKHRWDDRHQTRMHQWEDALAHLPHRKNGGGR